MKKLLVLIFIAAFALRDRPPISGAWSLPILDSSEEAAMDPVGAAISRPFYQLFDRTMDRTAEALSKKLQQSLESVFSRLSSAFMEAIMEPAPTSPPLV